MSNIKEAFPEFSKPSIAVDTVILRTKYIEENTFKTVSNKQMQVLLVKKKNENIWHLPGTIMHLGETATGAMKRIIGNKVNADNIKFEQLYTVDDKPDRDDRGHIISIVYIGMISSEKDFQFGTLNNGYDTKWFWVGKGSLDEHNNLNRIFTSIDCKETVSELMYDHINIINDTINRLKNKLMYTDIGFNFVDKTFTIKDLENSFNAINERDIPGFRRHISNKIEGTGIMSSGNAHRPAELYRKKEIH